MLVLLFAGAKRDFNKIKLHFTVSYFLQRKKATVPNATVPNAEFEASANMCNSMQEVSTNEKPCQRGKET